MKPRIVYADMRWSLDSGSPASTPPAIEQQVYGDAVDLDLGLFESGDFITTGQRFVDYVRGASGMLISRAVITPAIAEALAPTCKVVGRHGIGFDTLAPELLATHGIYAFNVPDYCTAEVSDHTLGLVLALERRLMVQNATIKGGGWNMSAGGVPRRLRECTLGIVGFGRIGRATARKAEVFYGSIIAYDPYVHADLMAGYGVRKAHAMSELLGNSDVVALHALLSTETRHLIGRQSIDAMKPDALLVNTARGALVDPAAVLAALRAGRIGGYASDVFEPEDPNSDPTNEALLGFENVIVSAHSAFLSTESLRSVRIRAAEEILRVVTTGEPPRFGRLA